MCSVTLKRKLNTPDKADHNIIAMTYGGWGMLGRTMRLVRRRKNIHVSGKFFKNFIGRSVGKKVFLSRGFFGFFGSIGLPETRILFSRPKDW